MEITAYNGTTVNGTTGIMLRFGYGNWQPYTAATQSRDRVNRGPQFLSMSYGARQQTFMVTMMGAYSGSIDDFMVMVMATFAPGGDAATLTARRVASDSGTEVSVQARVVSFGRIEDQQWQGTFEIDDPYWQSTTEQTDTSNPTTNGGSLPVAPTIAITNGIAATRNRATITDRTGHGLANYPVRIGYTASLEASNIIVYVSGIKAPFWYDSTSGALWLRVNCNPNKSTFADLYYSESITNTVTANVLDMAGIDPATSTNSVIVWNDLVISGHPASAALAWLPGNIPTWMSPPGVTIAYAQVAQNDPDGLGGNFENTADSISWQWVASQSGGTNDMHLMILTSPVPFAASNSIVDLTRFSRVVYADIGSQMVVAYRTRDDGPWIYAEIYQQSSGTEGIPNLLDHTITTALDTPGAVQIAIGFRIPYLELLGTGFLGVVRLTAAGSGGTFSGTLDSSKTPTVTLSDDIDAMIVDGTLLNSTTGDRITFDTLLMDDVALTLDPNVGSISPASGPWYSDNLEFTNASQWFTLAVGSNTWSFDGGDIEIVWHDRSAF